MEEYKNIFGTRVEVRDGVFEGIVGDLIEIEYATFPYSLTKAKIQVDDDNVITVHISSIIFLEDNYFVCAVDKFNNKIIWYETKIMLQSKTKDYNKYIYNHIVGNIDEYTLTSKNNLEIMSIPIDKLNIRATIEGYDVDLEQLKCIMKEL